MPAHEHAASASTANLTGSFYGDTFNDASGGASGIVSYSSISSNKGGLNGGDPYGVFNINATHSHTITIGATGGGASHNNLQPYEVIFRWKRTA